MHLRSSGATTQPQKKTRRTSWRRIGSPNKSNWRVVYLVYLILVVMWGNLPGLQLPNASGASEDEPHPHTGLVEPFQGGDPGIALDETALQTLARGEPYQTSIQSGSMAGRGLVIQDVKAPTDLVWENILNFDQYDQMVPKTVESKTYRSEQLSARKQRIWVCMKIGFSVLRLTFYVQHLYDPSLKSMTWTLDYTRKSDLDDSVGYWYVIPHPDNKKQWSRVYYSVSVAMFPWVPQFVVDFMSQQALTDATAWVKKFSEKNARQKGIPQELATLGAPTMDSSSRGAAAAPSAAADACPESGKKRNKTLHFIMRVLLLDRLLTKMGSPPEGVCSSASSSDSISSSSSSLPLAPEIGVTRYALVAAVLALTLYNVHLYFSL